MTKNKLELFRHLWNGKVYIKPLPPGEYLRLWNDIPLYDMRGYDRPIIKDSELVVIERKK